MVLLPLGIIEPQASLGHGLSAGVISGKKKKNRIFFFNVNISQTGRAPSEKTRNDPAEPR